MITKTRKQGNSITLTVPSEFRLVEGVSVEPELLSEGILYRFVNTPEDRFFDFSTDILRDLIDKGLSGEALFTEFEKKKSQVPSVVQRMVKETDQKGQIMTREEFEREIGL